MHPYFDLIDLFSETATKQKYWKQNTFLLWFLEDGDKKSMTLCVSWTMFGTFLNFCIAYGLKCHTCFASIGCSAVMTCPSGLNRCASVELLGELALQIDHQCYYLQMLGGLFKLSFFISHLAGLKTKSCMTSEACVEPIKCCFYDLCNSAMPAGSSPLLLLLSSAIITVFLWGSGAATA